VRLGLVGSRIRPWFQWKWKGLWVHVRTGHDSEIQPHEQSEHNSKSAPVCAGCRSSNYKGYETTHDSLVVTIFSAPNYVYFEKNLGGIALVDEDVEVE
jgi:hypothetical protein